MNSIQYSHSILFKKTWPSSQFLVRNMSKVWFNGKIVALFHHPIKAVLGRFRPQTKNFTCSWN